MKKNHFIAAIFALLITSPVFSQIDFLSPLTGEWANKQMLIIDSSNSAGDYFYSIDGSDPESFGFAYDGPVLLDVEGNIKLKVTKIPEFKEAYYVLNKCYEDIIVLLAQAEQPNIHDPWYRSAMIKFRFKEINGLNLGFTHKSCGKGNGR